MGKCAARAMKMPCALEEGHDGGCVAVYYLSERDLTERHRALIAESAAEVLESGITETCQCGSGNEGAPI